MYSSHPASHPVLCNEFHHHHHYLLLLLFSSSSSPPPPHHPLTRSVIRVSASAAQEKQRLLDELASTRREKEEEQAQRERERANEHQLRGRDRELATEREQEREQEKAALLREIMALEGQVASAREVCLEM